MYPKSVAWVPKSLLNINNFDISRIVKMHFAGTFITNNRNTFFVGKQIDNKTDNKKI